MTKGFAADAKSETDGGTDGRGIHVTCSFLLRKERLKSFSFAYRPSYVRRDGSSRRWIFELWPSS